MIPYTYEVLNVDPTAKAMEVVYSSPGRQTLHIGARMPYVGETLEAIVQMYAPVAYWLEQERQVEAVAQGATGSFTPPQADNSLAAVKARKLQEIAQARYLYETGGVVLNGLVIETDRETQATINGAYASLKDGLLASLDWKAAGGQWVSLNLAGMTPIAQAVAAHVQASFSLEKQLAEQVESATTAEEVGAIQWPQ